MARTRVLVTGAGGPAGVAVVRELRRQGHWVLATDASSEAVGLRLADASGVIRRADDSDFTDSVAALAEQHACVALISTVAEEMLALNQHAALLQTAGVRTWLPSPEAIKTCVDKWKFVNALAEAGLPVPASSLGELDGVPGPWIVKPRFGRGSRDVYAVDKSSSVAALLERVPDPVVQTRLKGAEFTADILVDRHGGLAGAVPRWRLETKAGISTKGRTFHHSALHAGLQALVRAIHLQGVANVQGFITTDGGFSFIEVNPRFSGGLPLSIAAGADLVGEYLRGIMGNEIQAERLVSRAGVTMLRYFEEVFEG